MTALALSDEAIATFSSPFLKAETDQAEQLAAAYCRALMIVTIENDPILRARLDKADIEIIEAFAISRAMRVAITPQAGLLEIALSNSLGCAQARLHFYALLNRLKAGASSDTVAVQAPPVGSHRIDILLGDRLVTLRACEDPFLPLPAPHLAWPGQPSEAAALFGEAVHYLDSCDQTLLPWLCEVFAEIALVDGTSGLRYSATVPKYPGLTYLSLPLNPYEIAARLVHEASHHYFHMLQRLTQLHDGTDSNLYFSPIKNRGRPIEVILFSFHAFGNGALFDLLVRDIGMMGGLDRTTLDTNLAALERMAEHLERTTALSAAGEALWRPIGHRLFG